MRVSHKYNFIFLANRRCGSTSLRAMLDPHSDIVSSKYPPFNHHVTADKLRHIALLNNWRWHEYFSFSTIRNPWARVVSHYNHALMSNESPWHQLAISFGNFSEFIQDDDVQRKLFNQSRIPYSGSSSELLVSKLFRIEDAYIIPKYLRDLGVPIKGELKHLNSSSHANYVNYFDTRTAKIVEQVYHDDLTNGAYRFYS